MPWCMVVLIPAWLLWRQAARRARTRRAIERVRQGW